MTHDTTSKRGLVLVVDDVRENRELIRDNLEVRGWIVEEAEDGLSALERALVAKPDVILLDVAMPGMDGLEVCRRLRLDDRTAHVPVIMVTGHTEREDRLAGIGAGANDYLAKPIDREDLLLRVQNACALKRLHDSVQENVRQLEEAQRLQDSLVHMIVHDLRSPLSAVMLALDTLRLTLDGSPAAETTAHLDRAQRSLATMSTMVTGLLDVSRLEAGRMPLHAQQLDLSAIAAEVTATFAQRAAARSVELASVAAAVPAVSADPDLVRRVLENLIGNALKFTPRGGRIEVSSGRPSDDWLRVLVADTGPGIAREHQVRVFDKFSQVNAGAARGTGLGLAFCRLAIEAHGGRIGMESDGKSGSVFWFELPVA